MITIFSGPTHVDIQGERVLEFTRVDKTIAEYSLVGFEDYPVKIFDYRDVGLEAINSLLETDNLYDFAPKFNSPALTSIDKLDSGEIQVRLRNTSEKNPPYMLWIAIGIEESIIPNYSFLMKEMLPFEKYSALFALYERPFPGEYPINYLSGDDIQAPRSPKSVAP